jgi:hypothetical protein
MKAEGKVTAAEHHQMTAVAARCLVAIIAVSVLLAGLAAAHPQRNGFISRRPRAGGASAPLHLTRAEIRARLLARARANHYRAPSVVLDRSAVFSFSSLTDRRAGVRVSRPSLSALPLGILELAGTPRRDVHQLREISIAGIPLVWVEPDAAGIGMYTLVSGQAVGGTTANLAQSTAQGMSINVSLTDGCREVVGVVPDTNPSVQVRTPTGSIRTFPVIDGVYVVPAGERHIYIRGVWPPRPGEQIRSIPRAGCSRRFLHALRGAEGGWGHLRRGV